MQTLREVGNRSLPKFTIFDIVFVKSCVACNSRVLTHAIKYYWLCILEHIFSGGLHSGLGRGSNITGSPAVSSVVTTSETLRGMQ